MKVFLSLLLALLITGIAMDHAHAQPPPVQVTTSQGSGWILLSIKDLNNALRQAGYPALPESTPIYGSTSFFPQEDRRWQLGLTALFWNNKGGETVALDASFFGVAFDWTLSRLSAGRISAGLTGGFDLSQLSIRKGLVFSFEDVLQPSEGQFSSVQRWGVWGSPYLQYELSVLQSNFQVRVWAGLMLTPWNSTWSQLGSTFDAIDFEGPPNNIGGPFGMAEISFGF